MGVGGAQVREIVRHTCTGVPSCARMPPGLETLGIDHFKGLLLYGVLTQKGKKKETSFYSPALVMKNKKHKVKYINTNSPNEYYFIL